MGLLTIDTPGSGRVHSFKTVYQNIITADILKKTATVSTGTSHYLSDGDYVDLKVVSTYNTSLNLLSCIELGASCTRAPAQLTI